MSNAVNVDFVTKVVEIEVNDNETESLATMAAVNAAARAEDAKNVVVDNLADSLAAIDAKTEEEKSELDGYTEEKKAEVSTLGQVYVDSASQKVSEANTILSAIRNEYGYPFTAATAADMADTNKIYVYTGSESGYVNGNWYYYNGSAWTSGGVYNSTAFETDSTLTVEGAAADAKAVGDNLTATNTKLEHTVYDRIVPYNFTMERLYQNARGLNCNKSKTSEGAIRFTIPEEWVGTINGIIFGSTTTKITVTDYNNVQSRTVFDFDCNMTANYANLRITGSGLGTETFAIRNGHNRIYTDRAVIDNVFVFDSNSNDAGKYVELNNIIVYRGNETINPHPYNYGQIQNYLKNTLFKNKKFLTIGDSLTNAHGGGVAGGLRWQTYVINALKMLSFITSGAIGLTVAKVEGTNSIYSCVMELTADSDVGLISFWGATNDWSSNILIGDYETQKNPDTRDDTTFYGGLFSCVEKLLTLYPSTPLYLVGTTPRILNYESGADYHNTPNSIGLYLEEYVNAVQKVAEYYGIPFVDLLHNGGMNKYNLPVYMFAQPNNSSSNSPMHYLHLSDAGEIYVGRRLTTFINSVWLGESEE